MSVGTWIQGPPAKILLATDLSARCDRASERALALAAEWKAEVVAVHVVEHADLREDVAGAPPFWRREPVSRHIAENRMRAELRDLFPDIDIVVEGGDPADAILRTARAHGCGLIVTGVARDELLGRIALGNTVTRLARQSEVPVLVARKRGRRPYNHIVVATDFSDSSRHALEAAARFFPRPPLTIFNAYDVPMSLMAIDVPSHREQFREAAERNARAFLDASDLSARQGATPEIVLEHGDPDVLLADYVTTKGIDLVAVGTHGRSTIFHVLIGSVAQNLIESLPCDVLIVREPRANAAT